MNRVAKFTYKHFDGKVPEPGELRDFDHEIINKVEAGFESVGEKLDAVKLRDALNEAMSLASEVNAYLDQAPWFGKTIKENKPAAATTMYTALRCIDNLKVLLAPFLPNTSERVHQLLGYDGRIAGDIEIRTLEETERKHDALVYIDPESDVRWEPSQLPAGQTLREPQALVKKLDPSVVETEREKLGL